MAQLTANEMGKRSWEARKLKYGDSLMKQVRKGKKVKIDKDAKKNVSR